MVLMVGGAGIPNYGDELIVGQWLRWYDEAGQSNSIAVEGYRAPVLRSMFGDAYPQAKWSHTFRRARLQFRNMSFWEALEAGKAAAESSSEVVRKAYEAAQNRRLIHVHGGGYLNGKWPSHAFVLGVATAVRAAAGARLVATGLGLGPLREPDRDERRSLESAVDAFDFIEVRDEWSYAFLKRNVSGERAAKVVMGLDDAYLYPVAASGSDGRSLHLSLRDDSTAEEVIQRLSLSFVSQFTHHYFWICKPSDAGAYAKVARLHPRFEPLGLTTLVGDLPLGSDDFLITQRFHPHLQVARIGATGVFISNSPYYDEKHGSLVQLGSPFVRDTDGAFHADPSGERSSIQVSDEERVAQKRELARQISTLLQ